MSEQQTTADDRRSRRRTKPSRPLSGSTPPVFIALAMLVGHRAS